MYGVYIITCIFVFCFLRNYLVRIRTLTCPNEALQDQFIPALQKRATSYNRLQRFYKFGVDNISKRRVSFFIKFCDSFIFMGQGGWPFDEIGEFTVHYNCCAM